MNTEIKLTPEDMGRLQRELAEMYAQYTLAETIWHMSGQQTEDEEWTEF